MGKPIVTYHDNRSGQGPEGTMFGFVYFGDGLRVMYTTQSGVIADSGGWGRVTGQHVKEAARYLDKEAPGWSDPPTA